MDFLEASLRQLRCLCLDALLLFRKEDGNTPGMDWYGDAKLLFPAERNLTMGKKVELCADTFMWTQGLGAKQRHLQVLEPIPSCKEPGWNCRGRMNRTGAGDLRKTLKPLGCCFYCHRRKHVFEAWISSSSSSRILFLFM